MQNNKSIERVLIVEDDKLDSELIEFSLQKLYPQVEISVVKNMRKALFTQKDMDFDLIFLDLNLPDNFGISSVRDFRKYNKTTPIIVTTGLATELTIQEAMKAGAQTFLLKSRITPKTLAEAVQKVA